MLTSRGGRPAKLHYMANNFRMLSPGDHVLCAVTGQAIPLDDLRYWSVERQEPYATAEISVKAAETAE
ncbi:DUF2093 domain-containing protein [Parasphingopyxis algicola]|uniref:DUF2093 domain-containing protein n=1 Tax=Parasphingopyxis algicola TaxID=2026624 RepID=UPI0015A447F8|nr:DUF2093 domain-containing protein [Parasphingopyxis algicola]QLC25500.1 DUF2093 domain-containing protein [Parasphingopyxis algicola]